MDYLNVNNDLVLLARLSSRPRLECVCPAWPAFLLYPSLQLLQPAWAPWGRMLWLGFTGEQEIKLRSKNKQEL